MLSSMFSTIFEQHLRRFLSNACVWLLLLYCYSLLGCGEDKKVVIAEKVNERVEDFKKKKKAECRQSLLSKAEKIVDSLLLAEAQQSLQDSLGRLRPFRPLQPPAVLPIDSSAVAPLFRQ